MRLPRDLPGRELGKRLKRFDYDFVRQVGSHMRFSREESQKHSITIPDHKELKTGTLKQILSDVSARLGISVEQLLDELFG